MNLFPEGSFAMGISRRLRNIALTQVNALKERLDRIDAEAEDQSAIRHDRESAKAELEDPTDIRVLRRTPEEIATGITRPTPPPAREKQEPDSLPPRATGGPLATQYKILGLEDGADLSSVEAAYTKLAARCAPDRFPEGSSEREAASEILKRVEGAYSTLKESLDATVGRFDKLEI